MVGGFQRCCYYDPEFDTWTLIQNPGIRRHKTSAIVFSGKILLCGGFSDAGQNPTDVIEEYDVESRTWREWSGRLYAPMTGMKMLVLNPPSYSRNTVGLPLEETN